MTGKIERLPNAPRPKVERAQVETPSKTAAVTRNAPVQNTAFRTDEPNQVGAAPTGTHVAMSARPDALWGGSDHHGFDQAALMRLSPTQQVEKLAELRAERGELQGKIIDRMKELDAKWETCSPETKLAALKTYAAKSDQLDPATRQVLNRMIRQAENAQGRIDGLKSRRDCMPPSRGATPEVKAERSELAAELRAARKDHKEAVKEATAVIDDKGLKADRLAVTEQVIDPNAPKADAPSPK